MRTHPFKPDSPPQATGPGPPVQYRPRADPIASAHGRPHPASRARPVAARHDRPPAGSLPRQPAHARARRGLVRPVRRAGDHASRPGPVPARDTPAAQPGRGPGRRVPGRLGGAAGGVPRGGAARAAAVGLAVVRPCGRGGRAGTALAADLVGPGERAAVAGGGLAAGRGRRRTAAGGVRERPGPLRAAVPESREPRHRHGVPPGADRVGAARLPAAGVVRRRRAAGLPLLRACAAGVGVLGDRDRPGTPALHAVLDPARAGRLRCSPRCWSAGSGRATPGRDHWRC